MINKSKHRNALYALQAVITEARTIAGRNKCPKELYELLDHAEYLPFLIGTADDRTDEFREYVQMIAQSCKALLIYERFEQRLPKGLWRLPHGRKEKRRPKPGNVKIKHKN